MRIQEPRAFGHVLREMEEIFSQLGSWEGRPESGHIGVPMLPPPHDRADRIPGGSSGKSLRDLMLKSTDDPQKFQAGPPSEPRYDTQPSQGSPTVPSSPFHGCTAFSKCYEIWKSWPRKSQWEEAKEDRDLDSAVSSKGLDQILTPPAGQTPNKQKQQSFESVTITKVVKPDGTVEERRTVRDSQGKEETTVTRSGGRGSLEEPEPQTAPLVQGGQPPFSDMRDDDSLFSEFFGGFK